MKGPLHHIATDKHKTWTPEFEKLFKRALTALDDDINKVAVPGHAGPHPDIYHQLVYDRLASAIGDLTGDAAQAALSEELSAIASELRSPGSWLNYLVRNPGGTL